IQKNPDLLLQLLATETSRTEHIEELLEYAVQFPITGVEIDYEKIPPNLFAAYQSFIKELHGALQDVGLQLRVVLEPGYPIEEYALPEGPQYVVMAYNLHGYHSGPGPKANNVFLDELALAFKDKSSKLEFALATGGFSWQGEMIQSLTENDVEQLIKEQNPTIETDNKSNAKWFRYINEEGEEVEVWYADATTLGAWTNRLIEQGAHEAVSIWRAGGLPQET